MILFIIIIIIILFVIYLLFWNKNTNVNAEHFNEESGRFCRTCSEKTPNQCLSCFNCGFCVDKWGNSKCIGGDVNGPYNFEECAFWYYIDPYSRMKENNDRYTCSDGPMQANRIIGV